MKQIQGKLLHTLQAGESWAVYQGSIIVVHPERPPKIISPSGQVEEITFTGPVVYPGTVIISEDN